MALPLVVMLCLITCNNLQISIYRCWKNNQDNFSIAFAIFSNGQFFVGGKSDVSCRQKCLLCMAQGHASTHVQTFVRATEKVCLHSHSPSLFLPVSHTHAHTHAIKHSASDQSRCALPSPPPHSPPPLPCSMGCKHYPKKRQPWRHKDK